MQVMLRLRATLSSAAPPPEFIGYVGKHNLSCSDIDISQRIASDLLRHHLASSSSTMLRNIMPDDTVFEELQRLTKMKDKKMKPELKAWLNKRHAIVTQLSKKTDL